MTVAAHVQPEFAHQLVGLPEGGQSQEQLLLVADGRVVADKVMASIS